MQSSTDCDVAIRPDPGQESGVTGAATEHANNAALRPCARRDDGLPGQDRSELHQAEDPELQKAGIEVVEVELDNVEADTQLPSTRATRVRSSDLRIATQS
ncbi:hypothetical protein FOZ63_027349 [Perkinsus olseni]|uniref:Uncharacterized protein n=1 Tax=Perkinsus olseni TaxID=32597 RepID=A0A7J6PRT4_PEROL|nr:hypothetical protein FOZ63_027349 [Perkinsus olseni]